MRSFNPIDLFQAKLLRALASHVNAEKAKEELLRDPELAEFHEYIAGFEPRMMEVAAVLLIKWGIPKQT